MATQRLKGLDTLRACAILMVIPRHTWEILGRDFVGPTFKMLAKPGWIGVDLFFVLSGFLIGSQLIRAARNRDRINFGQFYFKRSMRILPCYFAVLLLYLLWPAFNESDSLKPTWQFLLFVMNFGAKAKSFSHAWSLCVEEHFYLIVPLLVGLYAGRKRLLHPVALIALIILGGMALRYFIYVSGYSFYPNISRATYCRLDGLTVGVAIALLKETRPQTWSLLLQRPWVFFLASITVLSLGIWTSLGSIGLGHVVFCYPLIAIGFGCLLIAAQAPTFWLARHSIPGTGLVAALAYTLYLTHKQMIHLAVSLVDNPLDNKLLTTSLFVAFLIIASGLLHYGIEKPCLKLRDRFLMRSS